MTVILDKTYLSFDDVLIQPQYSNIPSREIIDLSQNLWGRLIPVPIISAAMDYVTEWQMAAAMWNAGGLGILHRFAPRLTQREWFYKLLETPTPIIMSIGVKDDPYWLWEVAGKSLAISIDVAHGHHKKVLELISHIKFMHPTLSIIAGNVGTWQGFRDLENAGADAVRLSIGGGSACTTRTVTGVGVPLFSAIIEAAEHRQGDTKIIADGGIRNSGDIVKSLAAGADFVMLGNLLAGHTESPGEPVGATETGFYKPYRGQSLLGRNGTHFTPEGVSGYVPFKGPVSETMKTLVGGIKSGLSYVGAMNLKELRENAVFLKVTENSQIETATRIKEFI